MKLGHKEYEILQYLANRTDPLSVSAIAKSLGEFCNGKLAPGNTSKRLTNLLTKGFVSESRNLKTHYFTPRMIMITETGRAILKQPEGTILSSHEVVVYPPVDMSDPLAMDQEDQQEESLEHPATPLADLNENDLKVLNVMSWEHFFSARQLACYLRLGRRNVAYIINHFLVPKGFAETNGERLNSAALKYRRIR